MVRLHNTVRDTEAETGSRYLIPDGSSSIKPLKNPALVFGSYTWTMIRNVDDYGLAIGPDPDRDGRIRRRILQSVIQKLFQGELIINRLSNGTTGTSSPAVASKGRPSISVCIEVTTSRNDFADVGHLRMYVNMTGIHPGHFNGVVHQLSQMLRLFVGNRQLFPDAVRERIIARQNGSSCPFNQVSGVLNS